MIPPWNFQMLEMKLFLEEKLSILSKYLNMPWAFKLLLHPLRSTTLFLFIPLKANGSFIIMCNICSLFEQKRVRVLMVLPMYFDHSLVFLGAVIDCKFSCTKEAEMHAITVATRKTKYLKSWKSIKRAEDLTNKNLVDDILDFSCLFKNTNLKKNLNGVVYWLANFSFERGKVFEVLLYGFAS